MFSFQILNTLNKICTNDTLLSLYILSSSIFTIWFLVYLSYFIFFKLSKNINNLLIMVYLIISLYFFTRTNHFNFISCWLMIQNINLTLQNGLLNIHPIYIYVIYAYIYISWFYNYKIYSAFIFKLIKNSSIFNILCTIISGIYLGAFWASQELNWGGFWSWDPVELISLFLFFWLLLIFHNKSYIIVNKPINHIIITALVIYFIIRLGVISTVHSFIRTNSKPLFSKICVILIILSIILNKKKYYYTYNYKQLTPPKLYITIILISCFYLCIYVLNLINFINLYLLNPIYFYFLLIIMSIYLICIKNKIEFYKYLITIIILVIHNLMVNLNIIISLLALVFLYTLVGFKKVQLHIITVIVYFLFFIFFININIYNNNIISLNKYNINLNNLNNSQIFNNCYEIFFFLKKYMYFLKLKSTLIHISGFSILTNTTSSLFIFSKNNNIYFLFVLELVYTSIYYLLVICIFTFINYKYLDYRYIYKIFNIKKY